MKFSVIIPSFRQPEFIAMTLVNVCAVKQLAYGKGHQVELLLFDAGSGGRTLEIINEYRRFLDVVVIDKDKGQYDAINRGIERCTGDYWTWLNTDDLLDIDGFFKLADELEKDPSIDYIYGDIDHIDENGRIIRNCRAFPLDMERMISKEPAIFQQGSFFRSAFTRNIGTLKPYDCCFDYEFVLRCISKGARIKQCGFKVAEFRQHGNSKTGSRTVGFIRDQLNISEQYGRKWFHFLTWFSHLRLLKHKFFPR